MKLDRSAFRWDHFSDQPATLDRSTKRRLRRLGARDELRKWLVSLLRSPLLLRKSSHARRFEAYRNDHRIGLCINLERPFEDKKILSASEIADLIEPLSIRRLAVRLPLRDIDRLEEYVAFIRRFSAYEVLVVVLQDRAFIEESEKLEPALRRFGRQALHARRLALRHPLTGRTCEWTSAPPADLASLLEALATDAAGAHGADGVHRGGG